MIHNITVVSIAGVPGQADDTASVSGAVLTHNGIDYDLSTCPDGGVLEPSSDYPFEGRITRSGSTLSYRLKLFHNRATAKRRQASNPAAWQVSVEDEAVPDLVARKEVPE